MSKTDVFFSSYNNALEEAYKRDMKESERNISKGLAHNVYNLQGYLSEAAANWEVKVLDELGGMSPMQYMASVESFEELLEMFRRAPVICDEALPEIYLEKLRSYGEEAVDALLEIAGNQEMINAEEDLFLVPLGAIRTLGEWKVERAVPHLISMLEMQSENYELFAEQVKASLVAIGLPAVEPIMKSIEQKTVFDTPVEYLLMALAEIGKDNKADAVYRCLKSAFQAMDQKIIGILCLKTYGDGRAVPALRGYLEKNRGTLDRETYYEIASAIKALGGSIDDL